MGYLTPIIIRNDGWSDIKAHPQEFIDNLDSAQHSGGSAAAGGYANVAEVLHTAHADVPRLLMVAGNTMFEFTRPTGLHREFYEKCIIDAKRILKYYESEMKSLDKSK